MSLQNTISYAAAPVIVATDVALTVPVVLQCLMYGAATLWYLYQVYSKWKGTNP